MNKCVNVKEPKTFEEQLKILESRNMKVENSEEAISVLKKTNYYRLTAYSMQFKKNNVYNYDVSFDGMYRLYKFDKSLRHLILEILESIEISLRTYMAYNLSIKYGAEAHKDSSIFKNKDLYYGFTGENGTYYRGLLDEIKSEVKKNRKELFVKHHISKYDGNFPIWAIIEIFSFGMLSKTYENLNIKDQKEISRNCFCINNTLLESWLKSLSYIRNICAHYGRLYNKRMSISPMLHTKYSKANIDIYRLFISILAIKELTKETSEWSIFKIELEALVSEYIDVIDLKLIGFPQNWSDILSRN